MTGNEVASCLIKLGYDPACWRDESSPQRIFATWDESVAQGFSSIENLISACEDVKAEVAQSLLIANAKAELARTDVAWGARLAEDAIGLVAGGTLPAKAQEKIAYREALRQVIAGTLNKLPTPLV